MASEEPPPLPPHRLPVRREDRPRSGILKIVGDPNYKPKAELTAEGTYATPGDGVPVPDSVPAFDFGPTYALGLDEKRPGTSGTMTQMLHDNPSHSRENLSLTPNEQRRQSYISGRSTPSGALHMRSASHSPQTNDPRYVAWQPGMASPQQPDKQQKLEPEDWVMHRASQQPLGLGYGHGRAKSHTPPPFGRAHSGDWSQLQYGVNGGGSPGIRPSSRLLSRPQSRGPDMLLDQRPTNLTAREQEQVARLTNTPLLDMSQQPKKLQKPAPTGLTGYIDFREKEKAAAKANRQGHSSAMQAEIDRRTLQNQQRQMMETQQRQRAYMEQQQQQVMQQQYAMAQSSYAPSVMGAPSTIGIPGSVTPQAMMGMAYTTPSPLLYQQQQQQQQYFPQQAVTPQMHIPGAWVSPSPQISQSQYFSHQSPQMGYQQQQQTPSTQPYGASFDQAQAVRNAQHQQGSHRR